MSDYNSSLPARTEAPGDIDIFISDATTSTQKLQINADGSAEVNQKKLDASTDNLQISDGTNDATVTAGGQLNVKDDDLDASTDSVESHLKDGSGNDYTALNPLPVVVSEDSAGDEICDYNTSAAIAKDASANHDYTVTAAKTFLFGRAWVSGSGKLKVEVLINGATAFVGFNSTANPNIEIPMDKYCKANATELIRLTITNRDNQPQDLYSTITGLEI